ncbi:MAG: tetratricopeptide repeat protein [Planctomycetota bacterium]|jgi:tetratricopeptide (TPR) repeat protein
MSEKWEVHLNAIWSSDKRLRAYSAAVLRDAVKDEPEAGVFWLMLGDELTSLRRLDEAEKALKRGLALTPPDKRRNAYSALGRLALAAGDFSGAEEWHRKAIEADPNHASGHIYLGALYADMCRLDDAEKAYRKATECSDGCVDEAYFNLGLVLRAQDRLGEARDCFVRAVELDPEYEIAREALEDVEKALAYLSERA